MLSRRMGRPLQVGLGLVGLLFSAAVASGAPGKLAVLELENKASLSQVEIEYLTNQVRGQASNGTGLLVMTRENITELLPPGQDLATCYEGNCDVEIGRNLGADYLVVGQVLRFGGELKANLMLYNTAKGNQLGLENASAKKLKDLEPALIKAAERLFARIGQPRQPVVAASAPAAAAPTNVPESAPGATSSGMFGQGLPPLPPRAKNQTPMPTLPGGLALTIRKALASARKAERSLQVPPAQKAQRWAHLANMSGVPADIKQWAKVRAKRLREAARDEKSWCTTLKTVNQMRRADQKKLKELLALGDDASTAAERAAWQGEFQAAYGGWVVPLSSIKQACLSQSVPGYVLLNAGSFNMGSGRSEASRDDDEASHRVKITRRFWLKTTEVTQAEWEKMMGENPSYFDECGAKCPVDQVSWLDAVRYLNRLSKAEGLNTCYTIGKDDLVTFEGLDCTGYRLPTEAEWEYAARAGTTTSRYGPLKAVAWFRDNASDQPHPVGQKQPNAWGLHDMMGNVKEWVHDQYGDYPDGLATDPTGAKSGSNRIRRGGSWLNPAKAVRSANRFKGLPYKASRDLGFRPARTLVISEEK